MALLSIKTNQSISQVSGTFLSILADLNGALVRIVSIFQFSHSLFQVLGDCFKGSYNDWYHRHLHIILVFRTVSILPLTSNSSRLFSRLFVIVPRTSAVIDITVTIMFRSFYSSLDRSWYFSWFLFSFAFSLWSAKMEKSTR